LAQLGVATVSELCSIVRLHEGNIRKNLLVLEKRGLATRDADGNWSLTVPGQSCVLGYPA
jgi:DNA-binding IclR family transcriptional regulator